MKMSDFIARENRGSHTKLAFLVSLAVGTLVIVYQTLHHELTEGVFTTYMLAFAAGTLGSKAIDRFSPPYSGPATGEYRNPPQPKKPEDIGL